MIESRLPIMRKDKSKKIINTCLYKLKFSAIFYLIIALLLSACVTPPLVQIKPQSIQQRTEQLQKLDNWQVAGKIAFIQNNQRQSASLQWRYQGETQSQQLDLTTFLGINVLHLNSIDGIHQVKVDGKNYKSDNLQELIGSLTGLSFPTQALSYWLKGLPYHQNDQIIYHPDNQLPKQLIGQDNNEIWTINYDHYTLVDQYQLATKFTIKKNNLFIKIVIHKWTL